MLFHWLKQWWGFMKVTSYWFAVTKKSPLIYCEGVSDIRHSSLVMEVDGRNQAMETCGKSCFLPWDYVNPKWWILQFKRLFLFVYTVKPGKGGKLFFSSDDSVWGLFLLVTVDLELFPGFLPTEWSPTGLRSVIIWRYSREHQLQVA